MSRADEERERQHLALTRRSVVLASTVAAWASGAGQAGAAPLQGAIVVVGDAGSGKSALVARLVGDAYKVTDAVLRISSLDGISIHDTSGHPNLAPVRFGSYEEAALVVLVLGSSHDEAIDWAGELAPLLGRGVPLVRVASHGDLMDAKTRSDARQWCDAVYSSVTCDGVDALRAMLIARFRPRQVRL